MQKRNHSTHEAIIQQVESFGNNLAAAFWRYSSPKSALGGSHSSILRWIRGKTRKPHIFTRRFDVYPAICLSSGACLVPMG
jgi:hypothetical protein